MIKRKGIGSFVPALDSLPNVLMAAKAQDDLVYWDAAGGKWKNIAFTALQNRTDAYNAAVDHDHLVANNTGTGNQWYQMLSGTREGSGAGANGIGSENTYLGTLFRGVSINTLPCAQNFRVAVKLVREQGDANTKAYFQVKAANTHGALAAKGIGLYIDNLNIYGELHDGGSQYTALLGAMTDSLIHEVVFRWSPGVGAYYSLDGAAEVAIAHNVGGSSAGMLLVASITNGVTAGHAYLTWQLKRFGVG